MSEPATDPMAYSCPYCQAAPRVPCHGLPSETGEVHVSRLGAAEARPVGPDVVAEVRVSVLNAAAAILAADGQASLADGVRRAAKRAAVAERRRKRGQRDEQA